MTSITSWQLRRRWAFSLLFAAAATVAAGEVGGTASTIVATVLPADGVARAQDAPGAVPVAIDIPKIGLRASVVPLAEDPDGAMQAPDDPDTVGWYAPGSGVGTPGNALLDGHVDWGGRLRVFGLLRTLMPGDVVSLTDDSGNVLTYAVSWTKLYEADSAPLDEIFAPTDDEAITLITCGGAFDPSMHMYVSRWVVRAVRAG